MPRLAANLSMLWPECATVRERIRAAAAAGFDAVEILFVHDLDTGELRDELDQAGLDLVLFDADPGDWAVGERGLLVHPDRGRFDRSVARAVADAAQLGTGLVNLLAGIPEPGPGIAQDRALDRLAAVCAEYGHPGLRFVIEAINPIDMPGYWLSSPEAAMGVVEAVDSPWLGLQLDAYHAAMMGRDPRVVLAAQIERVRHVQIADVPGRHEPGTGGLALREFLTDLDAADYTGWVGCEYHPSTATTEESLTWRTAT